MPRSMLHYYPNVGYCCNTLQHPPPTFDIGGDNAPLSPGSYCIVLHVLIFLIIINKKMCNHIIFVEMVDTNSGTLGNFQVPVWYIFIHCFLNDSDFGNEKTVTLTSVSLLSFLKYW